MEAITQPPAPNDRLKRAAKRLQTSKVELMEQQLTIEMIADAFSYDITGFDCGEKR